MKNSQTSLIEELGLSDLPEDMQAEVLSKMTETILKQVTVNVLDRLSDEDIKEFNKLQEEGSPEKMDEFLKSKIDNYDEMVQETIVNYKDELKGTISKLKGE